MENYYNRPIEYELIAINKSGIPMNPAGGLLWNVGTAGNPLVYVRDSRWEDKTLIYNEEGFKGLVAHEIGHSLGLWDAYPDANKFSSLLIPNDEIPTMTIMWHNGKATSNDIEMVLQAFVENKQ